MSERELRALGIDAAVEDRSKTTNIDANIEDRSTTLTISEQPAPQQELFDLNPHAANFNPATSDGAKNCMKTTEEIPQKDKLQVSITNGLSAKNHFENCHSKYAWGLLLRKSLMTMVA